jgi:antitoxin component YwqK of YwqJK toxin-antitoxin module
MRLFGKKDKGSENIFSGYDPNDQLRPRINKGDFFRMSGFDFGWLLLQPISIAGSREEEPALAKRFSPGQKALYFWWYLDAQVTNGGFVQFYYNGYDIYVPAIIEGLEYIGDKKMASLVKSAHKIYLDNKEMIEDAREKDLFGSDLYDRLDKLGKLDEKYYSMNGQTMACIETYARRNPYEFCVDEDGAGFKSDYTGKCITTFGNGNIREEFELINGVVHGEFRTYFETGGLQSLNTYASGEQVGLQQEWYANGNPKSKIVIDPVTRAQRKESYYENGQICKLENLDANGHNRGEYKEWYDNGQLSEQSTYTGEITRTGPWLKFWRDGSRQLEAEFADGDVLIKNYWNENGEQLLKDGTGLYINEYSLFEGNLERTEQEYRNYKRHGKQWSYTNGRLTLYQEMEDGLEHGITRSYYDNGAIERETVYEHGVKVSESAFDKFQEPVVVTTIVCEMEDRMLTNRKLETADTYPVVKNEKELAHAFTADLSLFEGYPQDYELTCNHFLTIDKHGAIRSIDFLGASNGRILKEVQESIEKLQFEPATRNGEPVDSYVIATYVFRLGESAGT